MTTFTYDETQALKHLVTDAGLTVGNTITTHRNIGVIFADEKRPTQQSWHTLQKKLYRLLGEREMAYVVMLSNPQQCEFPMLIFTPVNPGVRHG